MARRSRMIAALFYWAKDKDEMAAEPSELVKRAERWRDGDPDSTTAAELDALLAKTDAASRAELEDRFVASLEFGTAGLRGVLGAGPNRMNRAVVHRTTAGL